MMQLAINHIMIEGAKSLIVQHSLLNTRGRDNQLGHSTN